MIDLPFVFTIFFLTLGPMKTIPAFHVLTREAQPADRHALAARSVLLATVISLAIGLVMGAILKGWHVSPDAMRIAGSILLFMAAVEVIGSFGQSSGGVPKAAITDRKMLLALAVTPVAIPTIITPWGVAAILMFMSIARGDWSVTMLVLGILVGVMALNYVGMMFARGICTAVGVTSFQIVGWIFAVMQAGLAVEGIIYGIRSLGLVPALTR